MQNRLLHLDSGLAVAGQQQGISLRLQVVDLARHHRQQLIGNGQGVDRITPELVVTQQVIVCHPRKPRLLALDQQQHLFIHAGLSNGAGEHIDARKERIEREPLHLGPHHILHDSCRVVEHGRSNHRIDIGFHPTGSTLEQRVVHGKSIAPLGIYKVVVGLPQYSAIRLFTPCRKERRTQKKHTYYPPHIHTFNQSHYRRTNIHIRQRNIGKEEAKKTKLLFFLQNLRPKIQRIIKIHYF